MNKLKTGTVEFKGDRLRDLMKNYHLLEFDGEGFNPVKYHGKRVPSKLSFRTLSKAVLGNETSESTIRESCRRNVISVGLLSSICSYLHISPNYLQGIDDRDFSSFETFCQTSKSHVDITQYQQAGIDPLPTLMNIYELEKQRYIQTHVLDKNNLLMVDSSYNLGIMSVPQNIQDMEVYSSFIAFINDLINTPNYEKYKGLKEWQEYPDMVLSDLLFDGENKSLNQIIESVQRKARHGDYYSYEEVYKKNPKINHSNETIDWEVVEEEGKDNGKH